jgi:AcrR family transcriptional regulator
MARSQGSSARERILDTAACLFYRDGIHAVGIDTIIAESGVAKMTLYRYFPSKDELIAAYLERANQQFWRWLEEEMARAPDAKGKLLRAFQALARKATSPHCLGCGFQSAAAEFPDPQHPGHKVALAHKQQILERFTALGREARLRAPEALAAQLLLLMDGAWVAARIFGTKSPAARVTDAAQALVEAHSAPRVRRARRRAPSAS